MNEARFPGSGHSCDDSKNSDGNINVDVTKIVRLGVTNSHHVRGGAVTALEPHPVGHVASSESVGAVQLLDRSLEADSTSSASCSRPQIHHVICDRDRLGLVLDDEHGVSFVPQ